MTRLYMDERKKYKEIVKIMGREYQFYATLVMIYAIPHSKLTPFRLCMESQYKRQLGLWKLKRALPTAKKDKICKTLVTAEI
jgi:hypothetical protein